MAIGDFLTLRNTTDTTAIANNFATPVTAVYNSTVGSSGTGITYSSGTFTVSAAGKYLIGYSEQVGTTDTTNNDRNQILTWIQINGTDTPWYGWDVGFIRKAGGSQECINSGVAIVELAASDTFQIKIQRSDVATGGTTARIANRTGMYVVALDPNLKYGRYRGTLTPPSSTDGGSVTLDLTTTDEEDAVFTRTGDFVDIGTTNPVLYAYSVRSSNHSDTQRSEYQSRVDLAGSTVNGSYDQCYARGSQNTDCCGMSAGGLVYPTSGDDISVELVTRDDGDITADFDLNLQLVELPPTAKAIVVEATSGNMNTSGANFAFDTNPHIDTDVFTHTAGTDTIEVDEADDYLVMASLAVTSYSAAVRAVPAHSWRVNTTSNGSFAASTYNRGTGTSGHGAHATTGLLDGLAATDQIHLRGNRIGTNSTTMTVGSGGMSVLQLSSILPTGGGGVTVNATTIAGTSTVPAVTVTTGTGVTVAPATVGAVAAVPAVTVTQGAGVTVAPATIAAVATTPAVTVEVSDGFDAATIAAVAAVPAVTVSTGTGVTVAPAVIAAVAATPAVTVTTGTGVTVSPATIAAVAAMPAVTVTAEGSVTVTPGTITAVAAVPSVSVQVADGAAPATIEAVAAVPTVTVSTGTGVTVSAGTITATTAVPSVTITVAETVTPATITATASVPAVSVSTGTGVTVSAATITAVAAVPAPTITITSGDTVVDAESIAATSNVFAPTFTLGQGVTVTVSVNTTASVGGDVTTGNGVTFTAQVVTATTTVPLAPKTYVLAPRTSGSNLDVLPYHVVRSDRRLKARITPPSVARNLFVLTDDTVVTRKPYDSSLVVREILAGHVTPLRDNEILLMENAGYGLEVK